MAHPAPPSQATSRPRPADFSAAFLSYLIPGLGQIYQGRVGKGILFLVCLYTLFFYGMYLGSWSNVYLPDTSERNNPWHLPSALANVYNRLQFAGQFWIGVAAWPALWQYNQMPVPSEETSPFWHDFQRTPPERRDEMPDWKGKTLNELQADGDKTWDLAWVFTVIAGVLNILVIYDAFAGPAFGHEENHPQPAATKEAAS
jgi:TM2 domain-containing membrane protein YozV